MVIAIDGPAGSGKSTVARLAAKKLGVSYVDSGAIYRAYTLQFLNNGINLNDEQSVSNVLNQTKIELENSDDSSVIFLNGRDVTKEIRSFEVTALVSSVSEIPQVREAVNRKLREIPENTSIVLEGRDIGTVVFPDADFKFYLDASIEERAKRRYKEVELSEKNTDLEEIKGDIQRRDKQDKERSIAPLRKANDAVELDTTNLNLEQVVGFIIENVTKVY
ncbi:(d)CMP kinase [candidate division KSB1 bacterium]|nr:(d)CMP kinase [candidate division KSB1 bacterium]NIR72823.1 (d)CMP kinase [candidate division KSB1 bacterium]NIS26863.1 (d)CMP kinase [candidate division KSB1 bacterium]NIT73659.1 (d)CMP kinase [candidate division KSB1 bacterium]NIU27530.1 (d)CMP kinase [candidate division KSB1 bacterium]